MTDDQLTATLERAKGALGNLPPRRPSRFQIEHMVVGREPSHQGKLWRILEEVRAKGAEVEAARDQIADAYDQVELLKAELEDLDSGSQMFYTTPPPGEERRKAATRRMKQRRIEAAARQVATFREVVAARLEEIGVLLDLHDRLVTIEPVKGWDDPAAQVAYWEAKLGQDLMLRRVLGLPPDLETVRTTLSLPAGVGLRDRLRATVGEAAKGIGGEGGG